jgi:hypothetical protein
VDEILEISKLYYGNVKDISHALLKFELGYISASITNSTIQLDEATLVLKETKTEEIPLEYTIFANSISGSWEMGIGTRFDNISTQGVTWNYREGDTKLDWLQNGLASGSDSNPNNGQGATWFTSVSASQNFEYQSADIEINVKSLLKSWMSGSISNDGVIIKFDDTLENDTEDYGQLKFFSKETNTIYLGLLLSHFQSNCQ